MKDLVVSAYASRQCLQAAASVCVSGVCLRLRAWPECAANPFKCLLIRPSTPFPALTQRTVSLHTQLF